ncbi:MAG: adenylosuccinate lyase [Phycisphaeraceae bacterium]|nr:adenylosuccinate lyase [Phycisphaeraceae bacterium]
MSSKSRNTSARLTPSPYDTYVSPLATRNASERMLRLWSARHKFNTWRRIWLAVAEAQHEMGLPVTKEQVEELRAVVERKNSDGSVGITDDEIRLAEKYERELRHDVMAHVHALGDSCPKAKGIIHLGMTSQDVVCNADLLVVREAVRLAMSKLTLVACDLSTFADRWKSVPCLGFTHYQPAQPVTIGRRAAVWSHDLYLCERRRNETIHLRGFRGATGTQASFVAFQQGGRRKQSPLGACYSAIAEWERSAKGIDPGTTRYQYARTAERVVRDLNRSNSIHLLADDNASAFSLLQAAGWDKSHWYSTFNQYLSHLESVLPSVRSSLQKFMSGSSQDVVDISSNTWHELEERIFKSLRVEPSTFAITSQTYPRVIDTFILADLASTAAVLHKIATDIRLLCNRKELDEPFEDKQIGSSAMPYKRNPMRCERICGLTRFVMNLVGNAYDTAATQWLERTLDDSSNRRLSLPEAFLALDGALDLMHNVASGLIVHEATVRKNLMAELPFMATENILMACVKLGGDRQHYHEIIRVHAQAAGMRVKQEGLDNDLLDRLKADPHFQSTARGGKLTGELDWEGVMDPMKYVGRSVEQTERFIREVVEPLREQYKDELADLDDSGPRV